MDDGCRWIIIKSSNWGPYTMFYLLGLGERGALREDMMVVNHKWPCYVDIKPRDMMGHAIERGNNSQSCVTIIS